MLNSALVAVLAISGAIPGIAQARGDQVRHAESVPVSSVTVGDAVSVSLVPMPAKYQAPHSMPLDIFSASADSAFWSGPTRPNPHSWLTLHVVCRDTVDFRVEVIDEHGDTVDALDFSKVHPAAYRVVIEDVSASLDGIFALRFVYDGDVVTESKLMLRSPD